MKKSKNLFNRVTALVLSAAIVLPTLLSGTGASAKTSLPTVQNMKTSKKNVNILEIVPDKSEGSIGYYVGGYEPWTDQAGAQILANQTKSAQYGNAYNATAPTSNNARTTFVTNYKTAMQDSGLYSETADAAPLGTYTSYAEAFPWNNSQGYTKKLTLDHSEWQKVNGSMTEKPDNTGKYAAGSTHEIVNNGAYLQLITDFKAASADNGSVDSFYYNVTFTPIDYNNADNGDAGQYDVVFEDVTNDSTVTGNTLMVTVNGNTVRLKSLGYAGAADFPGLDIEKNNYYRATWGEPSAAYDASHPYLAVGNDYRPAGTTETGYFNISYFSYVGTTGGHYDLDTTKSGKVVLTTETVFYTGGFANNNWFLKGVFDWETNESAPVITVNTLTASKVTPADVDDANLIVLSYGFAARANTGSGDTATPYPYGWTTTEDSNHANLKTYAQDGYDISAEVLAEIKAAYNTASTYFANASAVKPSNLKAFYVDYRIVDQTAASTGKPFEFIPTQKNIYQAANYILNGGTVGIYTKYYANATKPTSFVRDSVFCYNCCDANYITPLATNAFNAMGLQKDAASTAAFQPVSDEISYANFTRKIAGNTEILTESVTIATSLRHILNGGATKPKNKTALRVLAIEPNSVTDTSAASIIDTVKRWTGIANVTADVMPIQEFVGKIDDISEKYDIVYISSNKTGFDMDGNLTKWTDPNMKGLVYSNVGDLVYAGNTPDHDTGRNSGYQLSGLLSRDYSGKRIAQYDSRAFRYSGNDLTAAAQTRLQAFAAAGYPIVVDNDMVDANTFSIDNQSVSGYAHARLFLDLLHVLEAYYTISISKSETNSQSVSVALASDSSHSTFFPNSIVDATCELFITDGTSNTGGRSVAKKYISGAQSASFDLGSYPSGSSFYVVVHVLSIRGNLTGRSYSTDSQSRDARSGVFSIGKKINSEIIDNSSNLYQTLTNIYNGRDNFFTVARANGDPTTFSLYANLSKPTIEFALSSPYPAVYTGDSQLGGTLVSLDGINYTLDYNFTIRNKTEYDPYNTYYDCYLSLDTNGDGLYTDGSSAASLDERQNGALLYDVSDPAKPKRVSSGHLQADIPYHLSLTTTTDNKAGIVPWQLKVVKVGDTLKHASAHNYTFVKPPEPKTLKILQINTGKDGHCGLNLASATTKYSVNIGSNAAEQANNKTFHDLFSELQTNGIFKVDITTVTTTTFNNSPSTTYIDAEGKTQSYDMLILGFDDAYPDLTGASATVVSSFIDSGRATLFTHDTTSYEYAKPNVSQIDCGYYYGFFWDFDYYSYSRAGFGYNFNQVLRDKFGLDRYGVQSSNATLRSFVSGTSYDNTTSNNQSSDRNNLLSSLSTANYSIAYRPKTNRSRTVGETQGLSTYILNRFWQQTVTDTYYYYGPTGWIKYTAYTALNSAYPYYKSSLTSDATKNSTDDTGNNILTTTVSQVNDGQITTYPFNVNTEAIKNDDRSKANSVTVARTHGQYFQLNLNRSDVVVWYCLSGGFRDSSTATTSSQLYSAVPNDVTNNYYIYSRGNITYTGAGHMEYDNSGLTTIIGPNEAKLFVNTIIASYRSATTPSAVNITNSTGSTAVTQMLYPTDDGSAVTNSAAPAQNIYFKISDTNIGSKSFAVTFDVGSNLKHTFSIYEAGTDASVSPDDIKAGVVYYIRLSDVVALNKNSDKNSDKISAPASITLNVTPTVNGTAKEEINKVLTLQSFSLDPLA